MPNIKPVSAIAAKWARVTPTRETDFRDGVSDPTVKWAEPTAAAETRFRDGVTAAANRGAFSAGVNRVGTEKWRRKVVALGVSRWGPGVREAQPDFEKGFAPFREVIAATVLPDRAPRGDPRNLDRAAAMARALSEAKRAGR